jgi:predicted chitinase
MNLIGEGFHPNIITEINRRQKIQGYRASSGASPLAPTPQVLDYLFARTGWVKMVSSVDIIDINTINSPGIKSLGFGGDKLAKEFVLFNGVGKTGSPNSRGGIVGGEYITSNNPLTPQQKASNIIASGKAYGLGDTKVFGQSPMMGIISANIKTETKGSLKTATVQIKAFNKVQFDIIDNLYMRLGYSVLLEFGYSHYFQGTGLNGLRENEKTLENEYFSGTNDYYSLLDLAIKRRNESYGNYDAIIGRVVNFSWTFNTDGSYDITVIIRSQGDVIESLKLNTLLDTKPLLPNAPLASNVGVNTTQPFGTPNFTAASAFPTDQKQTIDQSTELGKLYVKCKKALDETNETAVAGCTVINVTIPNEVNNYDINVLKQKFSPPVNNQDPEYYYIKLGSLFDFIQTSLLPQLKSNNKTSPILKFNTNVKNNLIYTLGPDYAWSANLKNILVNSKVTLEEKDYVIAPNAEPFLVDANSTQLGQLMNVYVSFDFLLSIFTTNSDPEVRVSLIKFLGVLSNEISKDLGSLNVISPAINEETNEVIFIDQTSIPNRDKAIKYVDPNISTELAEFELYGYQNLNTPDTVGSFIQNFSLKTGITPQFASMITIGATSQGYVVGEDATILSQINKGLKDRVKSEVVDANATTINSALENAKTKFEEQGQTLVSYIKDNFSVDNSIPKLSTGILQTLIGTIESGEAYTAISASFYADPKSKEANTSSNKSGFIPFNLSLTMDGLSGMKVYQKFTVNNDYLPTNYPKSLEFIITSLNHTIQDNKWITNLESLALPKHTTQVASVLPSLSTLPVKPSSLPLNKQNIVNKIIAFAATKGIKDKRILTALLTVAQAESGLNPWKVESFNYSLQRTKEIFPTKLRGLSDSQITYLLKSHAEFANYIYGGLFGNRKNTNDGYDFRGRGLTQVTYRGNYEKLWKILFNEKIVDKFKLVKEVDSRADYYDMDIDSLFKEDVSIAALVLGKINGLFGDRFNDKVDYPNDVKAIIRTQNRAGVNVPSIVQHFQEALNLINTTPWIQEALNKASV